MFSFCFSSSRRCLIFSANVKLISHAIRVERRTHVRSFFIEEKKKKETDIIILFPDVIHSMLLQFEEINKRIEIDL